MSASHLIFRLPKQSRVREKCAHPQNLTKEQHEACDGIEELLSRTQGSFNDARRSSIDFDVVYYLNARARVESLCPEIPPKEQKRELKIIDNTYYQLTREKWSREFKKAFPETDAFLEKNWPERVGLFKAERVANEKRDEAKQEADVNIKSKINRGKS